MFSVRVRLQGYVKSDIIALNLLLSICLCIKGEYLTFLFCLSWKFIITAYACRNDGSTRLVSQFSRENVNLKCKCHSNVFLAFESNNTHNNHFSKERWQP